VRAPTALRDALREVEAQLVAIAGPAPAEGRAR